MRWIILIVLTLVWCGELYGQVSYQERIQLAKNSSEDRSSQITELRNILKDSKIQNHSDTIGLIHYAIAFRYRVLGDHLKVIDYSNIAISAFENSKYTGYQNTFSLSFLGESYEALDQDKESLDAYFQILEINPKGRDFDIYGYAVNEIARKFIQYEDYESAIPVIDQFLSSSYRAQIPKTDLIRILLSSSIAHSNLKGEDHLRKALSNIEEAEELYNFLQEESDLWISIDMQKAALSLFMEEPNASIKYQDLLNELNNNPSEDNFNDSRTMLAFNASYAFQKIGDFRKGLEMAMMAKQQFDQVGNNEYIESEYLIYDNLATAYLGLFQLDSAHYYIERGIELFPTTAEVTPSSRKFLLNLLYDQARIFYAQGEDNQKSLESALNSIYQLDKLLDLHIAEQVSEYSINNLKNLGLKYYQLAIDISYALYDQKSFWYFSEKTKGLQLLKSHAQRRNTQNVGVNQTIIDSLKRSVIILETDMLLNQDRSSPASELEKAIIDLRAQIVTLQREVFNSDMSIDPYDLPTMIDVLDREELVLQYQYGREYLYLQVVSNARSVLKRIGNADSINANVLEIREKILDTESQISEIELSASILYQTLLKGSLSDRSELFIIPDRQLFFLPFEVLRESPLEPYLIENYDVSYLPSGSFKLIDIDKDDVEVITVYKPNYLEGSLVNPPLPFIDREIATIQTVFETELINQEESKDILETFLSAKVMHFGGHAIVDGSKNDQSYLSLGSIDGEESRLRLGELYTISCVSDLITLSACNTGMGGILDGEGVSSITRGFLYAGARSVVNTLWTVDDQSTSNIVGLFYKYLSQGKSKSHAMRMAKLEYLKTAASYQRHPYYWAGIIGMGDMSQPIIYPTNWPKVFLTILIFVILAWFLTWRFNEKPMRKIEFLSDWEELVNDRKIK